MFSNSRRARLLHSSASYELLFLPFGRKRCFSTHIPKQRPNFYKLLSVEPNASLREIKSSYFKLAKLHHPDVTQDSTSGNFNDKFIELTEAYEVLSCPKKRKLFDESLRRVYRRRNSSECSSHPSGFGKEFEDEFPEVKVRGLNVKLYSPTVLGRTSDSQILTYKRGVSLLKQIEDEFREALEKAIHGPQVPNLSEIGIDEIVFPWAFEAEESTNDDNSDVLHIVSGSQYLGACSESNTEAQIEINNVLAEIEHQMNSSSDEYHYSLNLSYFGSNVGRGIKYFSRIDDCHYVVFFLSNSEDRLKFAGKLICHHPRSHHRLFPEFGLIKKFMFTNATGDQTHMVIQHKLAGVSSQDWFRNLKNGATLKEITVRKAWSPFAKNFKWLGSRLNNANNSESWSFEIARPSPSCIKSSRAEELMLSSDSENKRNSSKTISTELPKEIIESWNFEASLYRLRLQEGGIDPRIAILFSGMCSKDSEL